MGFKINKNGYWEQIVNHHTDEGLKISLCEFIDNMNSIIDFGCGDASYIKYILSQKNINVKAFDGNPNVKKITNGIGERADISQPLNLNQKFDVVLSIEVAEHIPKEFEENYINNLINHTNKYLIISWAIPGQGGKGHVNEQTNEYVIDLFNKHGFSHIFEYSKYLRNTITNCNWLKNTIFVFESRN